MEPSGWEISDAPFKRVHDELAELQTQFHRLEHITRGANLALGGCGPGNILREIAKKADRKELDQAQKELDQARMDNAHLHAQMAAMSEELVHKSEEIRKYHAEQTVIFGRIRELVGHPGEIVNKARMYDQLVESGDPVFARHTIPILVKYSRMMNNLFADIQKVIPPGGTPRRVFYQGPPESPTRTLYEEVGKVAIVAYPPTTAEPSQQAGRSRPGSSGKDPERAHSSQVRRKSIGSVRTGRGQSPVPRSSDRSRTPDRDRTPIRHQVSDREATPDRGKSRANPATPTFLADCQMEEPVATPPSRSASARDPQTALGGSAHSNQPEANPAPSPSIRKGTASETSGSRAPPAEETCDSEEDVAPSPNLRRAFTRLQSKASLGSSSLVGGLDIDWKERSTSKKSQPS